MMVASMIMPMEIARPPSDIRLASRPTARITMKVSSAESGRAKMTTRAPRTLHRNRASTTRTSTEPSASAVEHRPRAGLDDRRPLVERDSIRGRPAGRWLSLISRTFASTRRDHLAAVLAAQHHDDAADHLVRCRPSAAAPWRTAWPIRTSPTSRIVHRRAALRLAATIFRMSSSDRIRPTPRMMYCSDCCETMLPPTFELLLRIASCDRVERQVVLQQAAPGRP